uniref:G-protein coupled receptors family 1 profile domain-containing protein n=1 Tax=Plectus sambesii TaxID=2011161 RepID=A0A914UXF2_9BILA
MTSFIDYYLPQLLYGTQGLLICLLNGLLFLTIIVDKSLRKRKEMIVVAGLAGSDFIFGLGTLIYAISRSLVLANGISKQKISAWICALTVQFFLQHFGQQMLIIINLVISLERFVAVAYPVVYMKLNSSDAAYLLASIGGFCFIDSAVIYFSIYYGSLPAVSADCPVTVFPPWYSQYFYTLISALGFLSILIYFGVFVAYHRAQSALPSNVLNQQSHNAMQRRLTVTLGIVCFSTLFLFTIPYGIFAWGKWTKTYITIGSLLGNMTRMSSIVNVVIYIVRQKELRTAMVKLVIPQSKVSTVTSDASRQLRLRTAF